MNERYSMLRENMDVNSYKKVVATSFSGSRDFWKHIYDPKQDEISKCYSSDMISRKAAVFNLIGKYTSKTPLDILDVGCGPGIFMKEAAKLGHRVIGVDSAELMVLEAKSATKQLTGKMPMVFQGDIEHLPFKNNSFDIILCIGVLSYLSADMKSISELKRVVKKDGYVIIGLPNWLRLPILVDPYYYLNRLFTVLYEKAFRRRNIIRESVGLNGYRRYFAWRLQSLFNKFNLQILESVNVGFGPLTFWKKEFIPAKHSIRMSQILEKISHRRSFTFLKTFTNHWVLCLQKIQD